MPDAVTQIPEFFPREYSQNWDHLVQQKNSRLDRFVTRTTVAGKERTFNQLDAIETIPKVGRAATTVAQDVSMYLRWLRMKPYEATHLLDEKDEEYLGQIALPQSEIMQAHVMSHLRRQDDVIISAIGGTAYSGEDGTTANTLAGNQLVAVDYKGPGVTPANVGLNLAKIIAAKSVLGQNEVDESEELVFVYSQKQLDDLLLSVNQVSDADFVNVKALIEGKIDRFMGFTWVRSERLPVNTGTDIRTCYAYAKSTIKFAENARKLHVDRRPDKSHAIQIRSVSDMGAVRMEEKKVVAIACDQSP